VEQAEAGAAERLREKLPRGTGEWIDAPTRRAAGQDEDLLPPPRLWAKGESAVTTESPHATWLLHSASGVMQTPPVPEEVALEWSRLAVSDGGLPVVGLELWGSVEAAESSIERSRLEATALAAAGA